MARRLRVGVRMLAHAGNTEVGDLKTSRNRYSVLCNGLTTAMTKKATTTASIHELSRGGTSSLPKRS